MSGNMECTIKISPFTSGKYWPYFLLMFSALELKLNYYFSFNVPLCCFSSLHYVRIVSLPFLGTEHRFVLVCRTLTAENRSPCGPWHDKTDHINQRTSSWTLYKKVIG